MMEKFKVIFLKYKWYFAGGAVLLLLLYMMRNSGGGGGVNTVTSTPIVDGAGNTQQVFGDPTAMLAQMQQQNALALQSNQLGAEFKIAELANSLKHYEIEQTSALGMAQLDTNKWLGGLDSSTQIKLGEFNQNIASFQAQTDRYSADALMYQSNLGLQQQLAENTIKLAEIDANKFIANKQADTAAKIAKEGNSVAMYQSKTQRQGQNMQFAGGLINTISKFFQ